MPNPQTPRIILVDRTEVHADGRGSFLRIYDLAGIQHRIAEKRHTLWPLFQNARRGEPILTIFETYMNTEYIADAKPITDELLKSAVATLGERVADAQANERNRSTALSYAKDMLVGDKICRGDLYDWATKNYNFIKGESVEHNKD